MRAGSQKEGFILKRRVESQKGGLICIDEGLVSKRKVGSQRKEVRGSQR